MWISVTGGPDGLPNVPEASLFGHAVLPGSQEFLWIAAVGAALSFLLSAWMISSRLGRSLRALRDNPLASQAVGINPVVTRSIAFAASGAMAGLAGALFAAQQLFIEPDQFDFTLLIGVLVAVLIGGPGRRFGPVIGAIALTALQRATNGLGSLEGVVYAGLLAIIILALPGGVIGAGESLLRRLRPDKRAGTRRRRDRRSQRSCEPERGNGRSRSAARPVAYGRGCEPTGTASAPRRATGL